MGLYKYHHINNIISVDTKDVPKIPSDGLGWFMFSKMKKFHNRIAQYGMENNESETYSSLLKRSIRTAIEMKNRGIMAGDIISICSYNQMDCIVPFIAAQFLGAIVASLDPIISTEETQYLLEQVNPKMIFFSDDITERMELIMEATKGNTETVIFGKSDKHAQFSDFTLYQEKEENFQPIKVDNSTTCVIFFSSGTTGLPKGIEVPHSQILFNGILFPSIGFNFTVSLNMASLFWISSITCLASIIDQGAARINCKGCSLQEFWNMVEKYEVSFAFLSTAFALQALKVGRPPNVKTSSLNGAVIGGSPISAENLQTIRDIFYDTQLAFGYGQTEIGCITSFKLNDPGDIELMKIKGNSTGLPICGLKYKVVDVFTNEILGPNKRGELRLKASYHMNGYYKHDSSTAWDEDGWLRTGDVVYYDEDFCFYVVDRIKEMLKYQCLVVTPTKIEGILRTHPDVSDTAVIGLPHEYDGDHPMAIVVKNNGSDVTAEELIKYVEERVDDKHKLRGGVMFLEKLPYTSTGKVKRNELKQMIIKSTMIHKNISQ